VKPARLGNHFAWHHKPILARKRPDRLSHSDNTEKIVFRLRACSSGVGAAQLKSKRNEGRHRTQRGRHVQLDVTDLFVSWLGMIFRVAQGVLKSCGTPSHSAERDSATTIYNTRLCRMWSRYSTTDSKEFSSSGSEKTSSLMARKMSSYNCQSS